VIREACVHGRFQPFHNEHLSYVLAAKGLCEFLWIGIARPEPRKSISTGQTHREIPENNPLTYYERARIISAVLFYQGIPYSSFSITPFPIDEPELLTNFIPTTVHCITTINDQWNREKNRRLEALGYHVNVLWERPKKIHGSAIRSMIASGNSSWRNFVPDTCAELLTQWDIESRLRRIIERKDPHPR
jgi:nicotinamide mononucleotide adenylyltransferase